MLKKSKLLSAAIFSAATLREDDRHVSAAPTGVAESAAAGCPAAPGE